MAEPSSIQNNDKVVAKPLPFRGIFLHAWDLAEKDADETMGWLAQAGLNVMCMASAYHSGWLLHPGSRLHRAFMTEGSVCYFRPQEDLYRNTRLRPQLSAIGKNVDSFTEVARRLDHYDLRLVAWTVGAHNTRLGLAHPELTVQNVYGDHIWHGLCVANAEVREYLKAICRDLALNYPLWGVQLEAFSWAGFSHGHHHERDLVALRPFEQALMALCFCPACAHQSGLAGVDIESVRMEIKRILDGVFREAPHRPRGHPESMDELGVLFPEFQKFERWRKSVEDSLIREIKTQSLKGTECRLLLQTPYDSVAANVVDGFACGAYQQEPDEVARTCQKAGEDFPPSWNGLFQCFIQLGMGIPQSEAQLRGIITAVGDSKCNGINFYNLSESPPKMLNWLAKMLPEFLK